MNNAFERVTEVKFNSVDMMKGEFGELILKGLKYGDLYALKINQDLLKYKKDEDNTCEVNIFKLNNGEDIREFGGKEFPISYTLNKTKNMDYIELDYETGDSELLVYDNEARCDNNNYNLYVKLINSEIPMDYFILNYDPYLNDNRLFVHRMSSNLDIRHTMTTDINNSFFSTIIESLIGGVKIECGLDNVDIESANFEYIIILSRCTNMSPLLYGYLVINNGEYNYRVTAGNYCVG